jgi:hypothetical protein
MIARQTAEAGNAIKNMENNKKGVPVTPTSEDGIAPLNGVPTPMNPYAKKDEGGKEMSEKEKQENENVIEMSYSETIDFLRGEHPLAVAIDEMRREGLICVSREEFESRLSLVIKRQEGKVDVSDVPNADARAKARENESPESEKEYADRENLAFPVDSEKRASTAHAYIHKYWNMPSKKGITATYGRDDFIRVHNSIVAAMKKFGVTHNYLDSLDEASGYKKGENGEAVSLQSCNKSGQKLSGSSEKSSTKLSFDFAEKQRVVSWSRNRMREAGSIEKIEGLVATVRWECGLVTTELLASLMPSMSAKK